MNARDAAAFTTLPRTEAEQRRTTNGWDLCRQLEAELAYMRARNAEQATGQFGPVARKHADETIAVRAEMQREFEEGKK